MLGKLDSRILKQRIRSVSHVDESSRLRGLQVPLLYLRATGDYLVPASAARLIVEQHPNTRIETIRGPHALLHVQAQAAADAIAAFINSVGEGNSARQPG
ncbi:MAG: hypothetical protein R3F01_02200 [Lysobacteraceae bacterium]